MGADQNRRIVRFFGPRADLLVAEAPNILVYDPSGEVSVRASVADFIDIAPVSDELWVAAPHRLTRLSARDGSVIASDPIEYLDPAGRVLLSSTAPKLPVWHTAQPKLVRIDPPRTEVPGPGCDLNPADRRWPLAVVVRGSAATVTRYRILPLLVVAFVGCKKSGSKAHDEATGSGSAQTTATPADAAPTAPAGLAGRDDGVGPLDAKTKVEKPTLAAAFPDYEVKQVSTSHGGDLKEDYWGISKGGQLVLRVHAEDTILSSIDIVSPDVANPLGVKVGSTYADVVKALGPLGCQNAGEAIEWRANIVLCSSKKSDVYSLDFTLYKESGLSATELLADPAQLAKAKLVAITWEPPGKGPKP